MTVSKSPVRTLFTSSTPTMQLLSPLFFLMCIAPTLPAIGNSTPSSHFAVSSKKSVHPQTDRKEVRGELLAHTALSYRGMPYVWGGASPRTGFDCSGFVQAVCKKWGIYLPHCAAEQIHEGRYIPKKDLLPGDLVFFKNTYEEGVSHVGIYVGLGWFMHAADVRSGVILSNLNTPYNLHHWCEALRLNFKPVALRNGKIQTEVIHVTVQENGGDKTIVVNLPDITHVKSHKTTK